MIDQQLELASCAIEPGGWQIGLSKSGPGDRHRIDWVGLAGLSGASTFRSHQPWRDTQHLLTNPKKVRFESPSQSPAVFQLPLPVRPLGRHRIASRFPALVAATSEAQFIRYAHAHLRPWFRYLPDRPGYNKRLRHSGQLFHHVIAYLTRQCPSWTDDVWCVDSTPVECGRSRQTAKRSDLAGWAEYGYCASHSRFFWGLRLHLITTPSGLPVAYALAGAKTDERDTCLDMIALGGLDRCGQTLIADKGYRRQSFEAELTSVGITLIRPALKSEKTRPGATYLRAFRQIIESVNQTLKAQLDLERHGGRTKPGVCARVLQRICALTTAIWHNETSQQPSPARSLTAYDH